MELQSTYELFARQVVTLRFGTLRQTMTNMSFMELSNNILNHGFYNACLFR